MVLATKGKGKEGKEGKASHFFFSPYFDTVISMRTGITTALLTGCLLGPVLKGAAQELPDIDALINTGLQWTQSGIPQSLLDQLSSPSPKEWNTFLAKLQEELQSGSIEDLAEWKPYVELGAQLLSRLDGGGDYADWLRQRLDYFEVASAAVEEAPDPGPRVRPAPLIIGRNAQLIPPASTPARKVSPALHHQRETLAGSAALWKKKLSARPVPPAGKALVPKLKAIFKEEGLPPALIWMAEVESSMNARARSPSGAAGLFQLMPDTARRFDLSLFPIDERNHPEKSARAAARYLRILYQHFESWPLAVAAYNAGEGRVHEALASHKTKTFSSISETLPAETRLYVPKVSALIHLREGVDNLNLPAPTRIVGLLPPDSQEFTTMPQERIGDIYAM